MPPGGKRLIEREEELGYLDDLIRSVQGNDGAFLLVDGPAGVGKTSLRVAAARHAEAEGLEVLSARGGELEREFPYGVVRQLFERTLRRLDDPTRAEILEGAASLAAPVLGFDSAGPASATLDAPFAAVHGLYWLAAGIAARRPLVLVIDDLHWADAPSLRWLAYLVRRLDGLPVLVLAAQRTDESDEFGLIDSIRLEPTLQVMSPRSLSPAAVAEIVRSRHPDATSEFCAACHRVSAGNPFYLRELLDAAERTGLSPNAQGAREIPSLGPANVASAVLGRTLRYGRDAEAVARVLAVLDADASLRLVAELAKVDEAAAAKLIDRLVGARILARGRAFQFVHPVVRTAIYEDIPPAERLRLHGAAFTSLREAGAAADRLARHLLQIEPGGHPEAIHTLRTAAEQAQKRGAPDLAARYLRRALDETRALNDQPAVTRDLGLALLADREPAAFEHLRRAIEMSHDVVSREAWSLELVRALAVAGRPAQAAEFAASALAAGITDQGLAVRIESELLAMTWLMPEDSPAGVERLERLEAEGVPPELEHLIVVHRALRNTAEGGPAEEAISMARRAIEGGLLLEEQSSLPFVALITLIWNDELELPRQICDAALALAQQMGSPHLTVNAGAFGGLAAIRAGLLAEAVGAASVSYRFARESAMPGSVDWAWALAILLDALRERGELQAAQDLLRAADAEGELPGHVTFVFLRESRGRLRCAQGSLEQGVADLLDSGRRWEPFGLINPNVSAWRSDAALALLRLGRHADAAELADEELALARAAGAPRGLGVALRSSGIVHRDAEFLAEAVELLGPSPARLDHAYALCELGAARRVAGSSRDAREPLLKALDLARRCTAVPLAERVRAELAAIGSKPRRDFLGGVESLTPAELRVAQMAADGRTNKEIAQALFLTLRTVETHLTHAYRKLDIDSRAGLEGALTGIEVAV